jgi:hypothetical protein
MAFLGMACAGAIACGTTEGGVGQTSAAVHGNAGSVVSPAREPTSSSGSYPQVVAVITKIGGACTGTIVGPYAVLSASHCAGGWGPVILDGEEHAAAATLNNPYLDPAYTPDWWLQLNEAQKASGVRQGDWPAQHDHSMFFVPDFTPDFLAAHKINPVSIDPYLPATNYVLVGVGNTDGACRDSMATQFVPSIPNFITQDQGNRDGYLVRDASTPDMAVADGGDSGGPSFGVQRAAWHGGTFDVQRAVFATTQNFEDSAPLGYNVGIALTPNQQQTVRLNALWAKARADDPDGDGLPTLCDPNPASATGSVNLCPPPVGAPTGAATALAPVGQLECPLGYYAVGIKVRAGWLIDQLSVRCRQVQCFAGAWCPADIYTDAFGGNGGGGPWESTCADGSVMVGIAGTADSSAIYSIGPRCAPVSSLWSIPPLATSGTPIGNTGVGASYTSQCDNIGSYLAGFQARSWDKRWTTGLQAICTRRTTYSNYHGGYGGGQTALSCPVGQVAVGVLWSMEGENLNAFGLLCGSRAKVVAGPALGSTDLTVVRTGYYNTTQGILVPPAVERSDEIHLDRFSHTLCATGYALTSVVAGWNYRYISGIQSMSCMSIRSGGNQAVVTTTINAGNYTQNPVSIGGNYFEVDGLVARTGWLVDGIMFHLSQ